MNARQPIAALAVTAAIASGVMLHEGFRGKAYIPVKGDVPTIGYGSARHGTLTGARYASSIDHKRPIPSISFFTPQARGQVLAAAPKSIT